MPDHVAIQLACRARVRALVVCTTGVISLSSTATGYHRASGSFIDDRFAEGMEVAPSGFTATDSGVITAVTDSDLTILGGHAVESDAPARSLTVGLPESRVFDNKEREPQAGTTYFDEQYLMGPNGLDSIGPFGRLTAEPTYLARVNVPVNTGNTAAARYAQAMLDAFPPSDVITLEDGTAIHVRGKPAPYGGQLLRTSDDFAGILCTIPLRCYSINSI